MVGPCVAQGQEEEFQIVKSLLRLSFEHVRLLSRGRKGRQMHLLLFAGAAC